MKGMLLSGLMIFLLAPALAAAQTYSDMNVVLTDQTPSPAEPGRNADIEISLQNNGLGQASGISVEIIPTGPFSLVKGDKIRTFNTIAGDSSIRLIYTLKVDDSAIAGTYDLEFRIYDTLTPQNYVTKEVEVTVIGDVKIIVDDVTTTPSVLEPGGSATIHVTMRSVGTGDARQFEASMNSSASDLVPVLSGGKVYLGDFGAGTEVTMDFLFNVDPDADQKTYPSTLTIYYRDENNQQHSEAFTIGVPVSGIIRFELVSIEADYEDGTLEIEIANKGTGDAQSVEARLVVDGETVGIDYLSSLKATKKTTLDFPLRLSGEAELVITYTEPGLAERTLTKELGPLNFAAPSGGGITTLLFLLGVVAVGYFAWKRFFRKPGAKKH